MRRSIKSSQRAVRQIHFTVSADGTTVSGIDKNQVTVVDTGTGVKTVTFNEAFASANQVVQVTTATADTHAEVSVTSAAVIVVNTFDNTDGTTAKDAVCHISVTGSDVSEFY